MSLPCFLVLTLALMLMLTGRVKGNDEEHGAAQMRAGILLDFVYTCSPAQCNALKVMVSDPETSPDGRALAAALLRVEHVSHPRGCSTTWFMFPLRRTKRHDKHC